MQVLYISGYTSDVLDARADLGNRELFLEKPVTRDRLLKKIGTILAHGSHVGSKNGTAH
jgi:hypothetical protein